MNTINTRCPLNGMTDVWEVRRLAVVASMTGLAMISPAFGQQFNIDLDIAAGPGAGVPAASFGAAANQPGTWNSISGAGLGPFPLTGLNGAATGVTLTRSSAVGTNFFSNNAGTAGNVELLMDDGENINVRPGQTVTYTLTGLAVAMAYTPTRGLRTFPQRRSPMSHARRERGFKGLAVS